MSEQKQVAAELDQRVAQRTRELAEANEKLRQEEKELKHSEARKAAILDSALDCIVTNRSRRLHHRVQSGCGTHLRLPSGRGRRQPPGRCDYPAITQGEATGGISPVPWPQARRECSGDASRRRRYVPTGAKSRSSSRITRIPLEEPPSLHWLLARHHGTKAVGRGVCGAAEAFLAEAQHLCSTGSFSWRVTTDEITWSEQLYRIFRV